MLAGPTTDWTCSYGAQTCPKYCIVRLRWPQTAAARGTTAAAAAAASAPTAAAGCTWQWLSPSSSHSLRLSINRHSCSVSRETPAAVAEVPMSGLCEVHLAEPDTYTLLLKLHSLCEGSCGLAEPSQLHAWTRSTQSHLHQMNLAELSYLVSCLQHHQCLWQEHQHVPLVPHSSAANTPKFVVDPVFLQQLCASASSAATASQHQLQQRQQQQQRPEEASRQLQLLDRLQERAVFESVSDAGAHHEAELCTHVQQLAGVLQWATNQAMHQRLLLQQALQHAQLSDSNNNPEQLPDCTVDMQAYRQQLQQQVGVQQHLKQLLFHPLLLQQLSRSSCSHLQQLLLSAGQLGLEPDSTWMGSWLAAARHAVTDLVLMSQQKASPAPHPKHHAAAASACASAQFQLVGLLSALATARVRPPASWLSAWQQASVSLLTQQPCFTAPDSYGVSSTFFDMLQQLLTAVSTLQLRLGEEFWAAHEGLLQRHAQGFSSAQLLQVLQLHQNLNLRPSRSCIKYLAAVLEQHIEQQRDSTPHNCHLPEQAQDTNPQDSVRHQQRQVSSSTSVLSIVMCTCALSAWGARLSMRSAAHLVVMMEQHKAQLTTPLLLQVLVTLGPQIPHLYSLGCAADSSASSSSSSSSSSWSSVSTDGEDFFISSPAAPPSHHMPVASPHTAAAVAVEELLIYLADDLGRRHLGNSMQQQQQQQLTSTTLASMATAAPAGPQAQQPTTATTSCEADHPAMGVSQQQTDRTVGLVVKLLQVLTMLRRNCSHLGPTSPSMSASSTPPPTAAAANTASSKGAHMALVDRLLHKLHPMCGVAALQCSPQQLLLLLSTWSSLGWSTTWRFGAFRRALKRLGCKDVLLTLSNAQLAAAVDAVAKLPTIQSVLEVLAGEVAARQQQGGVHVRAEDCSAANADVRGAGAGCDASQAATAAAGVAEGAAAAAALGKKLAPSELVTVACAAASLGPAWPISSTLHVLQGVAGSSLSPHQQWRVWQALQQLQQQWYPDAANASSHTIGQSAAADGASTGSQPQQQPAAHHSSTVWQETHREGAKRGGAAAVGAEAGGRAVLPQHVPHSDGRDELQELMRVVVELQEQLTASLAQLPADPEALPDGAAPPKVPRPLHAVFSTAAAATDAAAAAGGGDRSGSHGRSLGTSSASSTSFARVPQGPDILLASQQEGVRTQQQALAAFVKAQKRLLSPNCTKAAMTQVLEGVLLLLAVPRYQRAASKHDTVRRALLRTVESACWPDLLSHTLDVQQLVLLIATTSALRSGTDRPFMQHLQQELSRALAHTPLQQVASSLGCVAALKTHMHIPRVCFLKFWVGRLAHTAHSDPVAALAVVSPLCQIGFQPAAAAAALVLRPLVLAAAGAADAHTSASSAAASGSSSTTSAQGSTPGVSLLSPVQVLTLTRVLADMGLSLNPEGGEVLLKAHVRAMPHLRVQQLLDLGRCVLRMTLLTSTTPPPDVRQQAQSATDAHMLTVHMASQVSSQRTKDAPGCWLVPLGPTWVDAYLKQWLKCADQLKAVQVIPLQLLLSELDFVPWHLSQQHAQHTSTMLQQLQDKLAVVPGWKGALAAAVHTEFQHTQELRRRVAGHARSQSHQHSSSRGAIGMAVQSHNSQPTLPQLAIPAAPTAAGPGEAAGEGEVAVEAELQSGAFSSTDTTSHTAHHGDIYTGTRKFVSRQAAAAAALGVGDSASGQSAAAEQPAVCFSSPANRMHHQLKQLTQRKKVLLWTALKHRLWGNLRSSWVESCCFTVLVGHNSHLTPAVAVGLLLAVAEVHPHDNSPTRSSSSTGGGGGVLTGLQQPVGAPSTAVMGQLAAVITDRLISATKVLRGPHLLQALSALTTARVRAMHDEASSGPGAATTRIAVSGAALQQHTVPAGTVPADGSQPLCALSPHQQRLLLSGIARALPTLQPAQLPLLIHCMTQLQLRPDPLWMSAAFDDLAGKAGGAPAAQQLLLLAAARQLLTCGGVQLQQHLAGVQAGTQHASKPSAAVVGSHSIPGASAAPPEAQLETLLPGAGGSLLPQLVYVLRTITAAAAHVLGGLLQQLHYLPLQPRHRPAVPLAERSQSWAAGAADVAGPATAATTTPPAADHYPVALLLSSLSTQLQLAQMHGAAGGGMYATCKEPMDGQATAAAAATGGGPYVSQDQREQELQSAPLTAPFSATHTVPQQMLAAAVLLQAGSGALRHWETAAAAVTVADSTSPAGSRGLADRRAGDLQTASTRAHAGRHTSKQQQQQKHQQQQQQQRLLLGQLLQLQLQRASEQLVCRVWGSRVHHSPAAQALPEPCPTEPLEPGEATTAALRQAAAGTASDGQRLVKQGLQVQFDGLLRKALRAAAAAASQHQSFGDQGISQGRKDVWRAADAPTGALARLSSRQPWWLRSPSSNLSDLLQADLHGNTTGTRDHGSQSSNDWGQRPPALPAVTEADTAQWCPDALGCPVTDTLHDGEDGAVGTEGLTRRLSGQGDDMQPVLVLPVMSRALDAQFARLMRDVLYSSLAAGSRTARTGKQHAAQERAGEQRIPHGR